MTKAIFITRPQLASNLIDPPKGDLGSLRGRPRLSQKPQLCHLGEPWPLFERTYIALEESLDGVTKYGH